MTRRVWLLALLSVWACSQDAAWQRQGEGDAAAAGDAAHDAGAVAVPDASVGEPLVFTGLCINELMASNDGAYIDEQGETDDWVELVNCGDTSLELSDFTLADGRDKPPAVLPRQTLAPGALVVLWADGETQQGARHLPFKLGKEGESLWLRRARDAALTDHARYDALARNEALARFPDGTGALARCELATPEARNGAHCGERGTAVPEDATFAAYSWPHPYPTSPAPLLLAELALKPAGFIELRNTSDRPVSLDAWAVTIAPRKPGQGWPLISDGVFVPIPPGVLVAAGARYVLPVTQEQVAALTADPLFEGVVTLFQQDAITLAVSVVDRVDFMRWPEQAVLARRDDVPLFRFCTRATPGLPDDCETLPSRDVGDRVRHLYTPGDFAALARGGSQVGMAPVKFLIEEQGRGPVHMFSASRWPLHYSFVREAIDGLAPLDRCTAAGNAEFELGFQAFIASEYYNTLTRRFLLGTLVEHVGAGLHTVEFTSGDLITSAQMKQALFAVASHTPEPTHWALRPLESQQLARMREVEGQVPIVGTHAPFRGVRFQPLTPALAFGTLKFVPSAALATAQLGRDVIVVTDAVPNDLPFAAGLITEALQTPLAHINLLSQSRHTPNMALTSARSAPELAPYFDQLVRFEVTSSSFSIRPADPAEAQAFWDAQKPSQERYVPRRDLTVRGVQPLDGRGIADLPAIGAKAAQLAELSRVVAEHETESGDAPCVALPLRLPERAFAVPFVHYVEHFEQSGAQALLAELEAQPSFRSDPSARSAGLRQLRARIDAHPVDGALLSAVQQEVSTRFGQAPIRFRSSSNAEDLPGFNGAGLYESDSSDELGVEGGLKLVWSSLWSERAYDERAYANIDDDTLAMGVLIHPAFRGERANGVAMSRNLVELTRDDQYYLNVQRGEAAVTNPAPGIASEQLVYTWPPYAPELSYRSHSSFAAGETVLSTSEVRLLACSVGAIHDHFKRLLDPGNEQRYFAIELEFKLMGEERSLAIKQARPFPFATEALPAGCRRD